MLSRELFQILFLSPVFAYALAVPSSSSKRAVPSQGFYDPRDNGGTWLTVRAARSCSASTAQYSQQTVADTSPLGLSEPINAVILGTSDQAVLVDSSENGGLRNYFKYVYSAAPNWQQLILAAQLFRHGQRMPRSTFG